MYIQRNSTPILYDLLKDFKIVSVNGPRQSGKTTLSRAIAGELDMEYYTFDDDAIRTTAQNNPGQFIRQIAKKPSVIDEIQMVPEVVSALKMTVDERNTPGMFLLTGSADLFRMSTIRESLAGRMVSVPLYPFSCFEINKCDKNIVDMLFDRTIIDFDYDTIPFEQIVEQIIAGGYPPIQGKTARSRDSWFEAYIEARIEKDLSLVKKISNENRSEINKLLRILAASTANIVKYNALSKHLSIRDMTVKSDIEILEALFLIKRVTPYFTNRGKREIKSPKIHFIDTGLAAYLIDAEVDSLIVSQREILGNLVENFVYSELLKHETYARKSMKLYHYRDGKSEVDLVLEQKNGNIVAVEVKSSSTLKSGDLNGLVKLAQNAGEKLKAGYIFYGGEHILPFSKDGFEFWAIPLSALFGKACRLAGK